jgi:hypothetical protein
LIVDPLIVDPLVVDPLVVDCLVGLTVATTVDAHDNATKVWHNHPHAMEQRRTDKMRRTGRIWKLSKLCPRTGQPIDHWMRK